MAHPKNVTERRTYEVIADNPLSKTIYWKIFQK